MLLLDELAQNIPLPPYAYVPGKTRRHAEDWFDAIKASVTAQTTVDALPQTAAFIAGMQYFDQGYYWECHEVLETIWLQTPQHSEERDLVQAIIQLANARLKLAMGKPNATRRLCDMVKAHLARCNSAKPILGLRVESIAQAVQQTEQDAKSAL